MNKNGVNYFVPASFDMAMDDCGAIVLSATTLTQQDTYKERHRDDLSIKPAIVRVLETFKPAILICTVILVMFKFLIMNGFIPSESMQPTLLVGDGIVVNRLSYIDSVPKRGDVVVFTSDEYNGEYLIKRVIGLPGDVIDIKNGHVYVNGCMLLEGYAVGKTLPSTSQINHYEVPENSVFLLGDNREYSADSRWWKNPYISYEDIIGEAVLQYCMNFNGNGFYANIVESIAPSFVSD